MAETGKGTLLLYSSLKRVKNFYVAFHFIIVHCMWFEMHTELVHNNQCFVGITSTEAEF